MDVTCNIIEDLLPLYADGICSEDTKTIIEHHAAVCPECREKLAAMTAELEKPEKKGKAENPFKKVKWHYFRLAAVTLLICAVVIAPLSAVWYLSTNAYFDKGYTWSSLGMDIKLHGLARLLKRGKYREFMDELELYYVEEQYTPEEINMYKDMFAEDLENYFSQHKIRTVLTNVESGECENGSLTIVADGDEPVEIYFTLYDNGRLMYTAYNRNAYYDTELPQLQLPNKDHLKTYFDYMKLDEEDSLRSAALFLQTYNNNKDFNYDYGNHMKKVKEKFVNMLDKYTYVGCETGGITYNRDYSLNVHEFDYFKRYYSQSATITMADKSGGEFTVSCEVAVNTESYPLQCLLAVYDIVYSDNTPEDFKEMFEDIFIALPKSGLSLSDGKFYLNGDTNNCYFQAENGKIQLVTGTEEQMREYYRAQCEAMPSFENSFTFEEWRERIEEDWREAIPYIIHIDVAGIPRVAWRITYTRSGDIAAYANSEYIDENSFEHNECLFTRVEE
ncbi:MAG: zf-HC2 domain-containing protein [Ruminococcus sp.]|nr:zf-HC2 domain-containing protein [Ruminococcus sp.]MCM1382419.1 zf-HC2 domain-containing protein [Muribaculaceae bacterium]